MTLSRVSSQASSFLLLEIMETECKPPKPSPQREKAITDISAAVKTYYTENRSDEMPSWTELVADAKAGIQQLTKGAQTGGAPEDTLDATSRRRIVSLAYLLVIILMATMGYLMFQAMTSNVPDYQRALTGEGCYDLAYDVLYRTTGMSLYAGCAAHHRMRENILAFLTGYRANLVSDQGTNMQYLINWLTRIFGGTTAMTLWRWVNSRGTKSEKGNDEDQPPFPPSPPSSPPSEPPSRPWDDGGDDGAGGIATGGKRRRTRRSHKKADKTRRRKSQSRRRRHGRK